MDRGAWRAAVHRVAQSWTRLKRLSMQGFLHLKICRVLQAGRMSKDHIQASGLDLRLLCGYDVTHIQGRQVDILMTCGTHKGTKTGQHVVTP